MLYFIFFIMSLLYISWLITYYFATGEKKYKLECVGISAIIYGTVLLICYINLIFCPFYKN